MSWNYTNNVCFWRVFLSRCPQHDGLLASYCRLSVCMWHCALWRSKSMRGLKVVSLCFFRTVLPVFTVVSFSHNTQWKKMNHRKYRVWNNHGQRVHVAMAMFDAAFSGVLFWTNIVHALWNSLPTSIQTSTNTATFCRLLKTHFLILLLPSVSKLLSTDFMTL